MGKWLQEKSILPVATQPIQTSRWQAEKIGVKLEEPSQFMKGSFFQKVFDPLLAGQYAVAGAGRKALGLEGGVLEGIKQRASWVDTFQEKFPYTPSEDWKKNFIQELGRVIPGTIADIVLDPLWVIPPLKIAKMFGLVKFGNIIKEAKIVQPFKNLLGKGFVYRFGQPKEYAELAEETIGKIAERTETAKVIGEPIAKLSQEAQQRIAQALKGKAITAEKGIIPAPMGRVQAIRGTDGKYELFWVGTRNNVDVGGKLITDKFSSVQEARNTFEALWIKNQKAVKGVEEVKLSSEEQKLFYPADQEFKQLGKEAVEEGLLNEEVFKANFGKYLPRMYRSKEAPEGVIQFFGDKKPVRVDLSRFKKRKDIPEDVQDAMGVIKEAGYPTAKGLAQLGQAIERARFFRKVAENPAWSSKITKEGWLKLPETKALGELANKYVIPSVYDDIQQFIRRASKGESIARTGLGLWKWFKVIANPATQARNIMSNTILADLGGLPFYRIDVWGKALRDLATKGTFYKELKANSNILRETFAQRDIMDLLDAFEKSKGQNMFSKAQDIAKTILRKGGDLYQAEEQWGKIALYMFKREQGLIPKLAAQEAEKWLFNYSKVPKFIDALRGSEGLPGFLGVFSGAYPFITFSYKAIPRVIEVALLKTPRLTKWMKMVRGVEQLSPEQETQKEKEVMAEWMKQGMWMKVPFKDKYGRSQYLDLNFILPWGDIGEVGHTLTPSNPIFVLLADLTRNKSAYTGKEIIPSGTPKDEAYKKYAEYILMNILPSLVPPGYSYQKLSSAILEKPDYQGRTRDLFATFLDVSLGLKTRPIDIAEEQQWRNYEKRKDIEDVMARIRSLMSKQGISVEQREKQRQKLIQELQKINER